MYFFKKNGFLAVICLMIILSGCSNKGLDEAETYISSIEEMNIPDDVNIIGLGEATHGNIELQILKNDVFEALNKNEQVRVFVIEGDFGGGQEINRFILEGKGI